MSRNESINAKSCALTWAFFAFVIRRPKPETGPQLVRSAECLRPSAAGMLPKQPRARHREYPRSAAHEPSEPRYRGQDLLRLGRREPLPHQVQLLPWRPKVKPGRFVASVQAVASALRIAWTSAAGRRPG